MHPPWDDGLPIYQQLADRLAAALLDGQPPEGEAMPSVRALSSQYLLNPLTASRALQALADAGLLESRRGLGLYVVPGARERLRTEPSLGGLVGLKLDALAIAKGQHLDARQEEQARTQDA